MSLGEIGLDFAKQRLDTGLVRDIGRFHDGRGGM